MTTRIVQIPFKTGTTSQNDQYLGGAGEITIDRTKRSIRVHDGIKRGGEEILRRTDIAEAVKANSDASTILAQAQTAAGTINQVVGTATAAAKTATDARDITTGARDLTLGYRDTTVAARDITTGARDLTLGYRDTAKGYQDNAFTYKGNAATSATLAASWATSLTLVDATNYGAKKYAQDAMGYRDTTLGYRDTAKGYQDNANTYQGNALGSAQAASTSATLAGSWATSLTLVDATNYGAKKYAQDAMGYRDTTLGYRDTAKGYQDNALSYRDTTKGYQDNALTYQNNASGSATMAQKWATQATGEVNGAGSGFSAFYWAGQAAASAQQASAGQIPGDWTQTVTTAKDYIKNKPVLSTVATTGAYGDLSGKPTIPTNTNQLTNGAGFITADTTKLPLAGGSMSGDLTFTAGTITTRAPVAQAAITTATSAPIVVPDYSVPQGAESFTPAIHQKTSVTGLGYRQHMSLGNYRVGNASFNGGFYVGLGGNDANPTEYYLMAFGGTLTHSISGTFINTTNLTSYTAAKTNPLFNGNLSMTQPAGSQATVSLNSGAQQAQFYFRDYDKNAGIFVSDGVGSNTRMRFAGATGNINLAETGGGNVVIGTTGDDSSGSKLQVAGAITTVGAHVARLGDNGTVLRSQNQSASNADQFYVKHNLQDAELGNSRGALRLYSTGEVTSVSSFGTNGNFRTTGASYLNGATQNYTNFGSAVTVNYVGSGSQYGLTFKPSTSTTTGNALTFLTSGSSYATAAAVAAIQHVVGDVGMNLFGNWTYGGNPILTTVSNEAMVARTSAITTQDWNNLTQNGMFVAANATGANMPPGYAYGTLTVIQNGTTVTQTYYTHGIPANIFTRTKYNASDWNPWSTVVVSSGGQVAPVTLAKPTIKGYIEQFVSTTGTGYTVDTSQGTLIMVNTNSNTTIYLPPPTDGLGFTILVKYGGAHTITFGLNGGTLNWAGGTAPKTTSVAGKVDKYIFTCAGGVFYAQDGGRNF